MVGHVADEKLLSYLLAVGPGTSKDAAGKSKFFRGIGFTREEYKGLAEALVLHTQTAILEQTIETEYGLKKIFRCELPQVPNGRLYCIRTVWMEKDSRLSFVSAYPTPHPAQP